MKRLLAIFLLASAPAIAAEWTLDNLEGGKIHLTEDACPTKAGDFYVFSYTRRGDRLEGCWIKRGTMSFVSWEDGQKSAYPLDKFEMVLPAKRLPGDPK